MANRTNGLNTYPHTAADEDFNILMAKREQTDWSAVGETALGLVPPSETTVAIHAGVARQALDIVQAEAPIEVVHSSDLGHFTPSS